MPAYFSASWRIAKAFAVKYFESWGWMYLVWPRLPVCIDPAVCPCFNSVYRCCSLNAELKIQLFFLFLKCLIQFSLQGQSLHTILRFTNVFMFWDLPKYYWVWWWDSTHAKQPQFLAIVWQEEIEERRGMQTEGKVHSLQVLSPGMLLDMIQLSVLVLPAQSQISRRWSFKQKSNTCICNLKVL